MDGASTANLVSKRLGTVLLRKGHTCAHYPLAIIADPYALTGLLKFEILQQLDAVGVPGIILQAAFSFSSKPFRKRSCGGRARYRIDWYSRVLAELHDLETEAFSGKCR